MTLEETLLKLPPGTLYSSCIHLVFGKETPTPARRGIARPF